jgi:hypothetical protein
VFGHFFLVFLNWLELMFSSGLNFPVEACESEISCGWKGHYVGQDIQIVPFTCVEQC